MRREQCEKDYVVNPYLKTKKLHLKYQKIWIDFLSEDHKAWVQTVVIPVVNLVEIQQVILLVNLVVIQEVIPVVNHSTYQDSFSEGEQQDSFEEM